jgi:EAL domain-containing protein (putative c-di-GMP-specific phosphodiesterase class I)/FixJ family two-component response regulator
MNDTGEDAPQNVSAASGNRTPEGLRGAKKSPKILVMDDSATARQMAMLIVQAAGYPDVCEAASARAALDMLSADACDIDVVLCDLMMPEMDGVQFLRYAAALPNRPALVFVSAGENVLLQGARDTAQARLFRVLGTVQKPITEDNIGRILRRLAEPERSAKNSAALEVIQDLERGIAEQQFLLHYQPKISVVGRKLAGVEALVRWQHPDHGLLSPNHFIQAAEAQGKIASLTEEIVSIAIRQCAAWARCDFTPSVSVNLSAYMLVDLDFPDRIFDMAASLGVESRQIVLEVTESGLFQDLANTLDILTRLRIKGFTLSIDDFGTGYSSMDQLRRVPFSELKVDRAFVNGAGENERARAILNGTVQLARSLDMKVVAEGAETQQDWDTLEEAGVDLVQGFFIARPMPAGDVIDWQESWR